MNNVVKHLALTVCAVASLAGCAGTSTGTGEKAPTLPAAAGRDANPAAAQQPTTNERGFVVKQLGETACFGGAGTNCEGGVSFAIDQVEVDDAKVVDRVGGIINPFSFVEIGKDGVTRDASFGMCADPSANRLPDTYGPNQRSN